MSEDFGVIDALVDDEEVGVDDLRRALANPAAREYLIDALALRSLVGVDVSHPGSSRAQGPASPRWWLAVAALLTVVAGLVGYTAGHRLGSHTELTRSLETPAPAPTKVIQLQQGVDWTERLGGN